MKNIKALYEQHLKYAGGDNKEVIRKMRESIAVYENSEHLENEKVQERINTYKGIIYLAEENLTKNK